MRISIDGGAITSTNQFGNYVFTDNLLQALDHYDPTNDYKVYTLENIPQRTSSHLKYKTLTPRVGWMKLRVPLEEVVSGNDVFLAVNQALPLVTRARSIGFSHGLSFHFFPHLYPDSAQYMTKQIQKLAHKSRTIVVSSERVKEEFETVFPQMNASIVVLPFGIPFDLMDYQAAPRERYFLFSGMNHPIKNIQILIAAFKQFSKHEDFNSYKLVLAGPFTEFMHHDEQIIVLPNTTREQRKKLYASATAYVSSSLYESFNLPILEALSQETPVIAFESSVIPELKNYVYTVKDGDELAKRMYEVALGNLDVKPHTDLKEKFSWKNYVKQLVQLY